MRQPKETELERILAILLEDEVISKEWALIKTCGLCSVESQRTYLMSLVIADYDRWVANGSGRPKQTGT